MVFVFDDGTEKWQFFEVGQHIFVVSRALVADAMKNVSSFTDTMSSSLNVVPVSDML